MMLELTFYRGIQDPCSRDERYDNFRSSTAPQMPVMESPQAAELLQRLINQVSHLESKLKEKTVPYQQVCDSLS
jgi:hypothetical protein